MELRRAKTSASSLLCFKPLVIDLETDKVLSYPLPRQRSGLEMDECFQDKGGEIDSSGEKGRRKRGLIRAFRAVLLHIKLRRRTRDSRIGSGSRRRRSSCSFRLCRRRHDFNSKVEMTKSSSKRTSTSSTASLSSSIAQNPSSVKNHREQRCSVEKQGSLEKQESVEEQGGVEEQCSLKSERSGSIIVGLLLILVSLAITVLLGRLCAIAFNAMWMAFIPESRILRSSQRRLESENVDMMEFIREQRRVITEGLLDRTHHHQHHHKSRQLQKL